MKKATLIFALLYTIFNLNAQEIYFKTGKNFTQYDYKSDNSSTPDFQSGSGNFYEMGYVMEVFSEKLGYAVGFSLNEYNAIGGNMINSYSWNTQYLGINNTISVAFIKVNGLKLSANGGLGFSTLIYGKQNINGEYLDLTSQKEFSGLFLSPKLGLELAYNVENDIHLSMGYSYSKSFNLTNSTPEKLSFNTSHIQFGVHFLFR